MITLHCSHTIFQKMRLLREKLNRKFVEQSDGIRLSIRLPDSSKMYAVMKPTDTCLVTKRFLTLMY